MEPTTRIGDFLYVVKWPSDQHRPLHDRVVVFDSVDEPGLRVMKRVLGMPGDTLLMRSGTLTRNGRLLQEPYVVHTDPERTEDLIQRGRSSCLQTPFSHWEITGMPLTTEQVLWLRSV
jgi:signal peptidase I